MRLLLRRIGLTALAFAALWVTVAWRLDAHGRGRGRAVAVEGTWDAVVVAGCRVERDGRASLALRRRTLLAVDLWRGGHARLLVLTGGVGAHGPSEAQAAAEVARAAGVPAEALVLEERSTSTEENARFAAERLPAGRVLVVTDGYHVFRSERVFARHFDEARGIGSTGSAAVRSRGAMREVLAVAAYGVLGRL